MKADVVLDIETVTIPATHNDLQEYLSNYRPPKNWKDPEKLAEHRAKFEADALTAMSSQRAFSIGGKRMVSCALGIADRRMGRVLDIQSWQGEDLASICVGIRDYLAGVGEFRMVGWNFEEFDLPEIMKSFALTKTTTKHILPGKWDLVDLNYKPFRGKALKECARAFGLEVMDVDGSSVARLYEDGDWEKIKQYNEHDVYLTGMLLCYASQFIAL